MPPYWLGIIVHSIIKICIFVKRVPSVKITINILLSETLIALSFGEE